MKTQIQQSKGQETIQPKANKQAPVGAILNDYKGGSFQMKTAEEEEPLQGKFETAQMKAPEEEEPLQGKFIPTQLKSMDEEGIVQHKSQNNSTAGIIQKKGIIQFDRYVTDGHIYPHIHVGNNFVVFSKGAHDHIDLRRGDDVREQSIENVIENIKSGAIAVNVGRKSILSFLKRMKKGKGPGA